MTLAEQAICCTYSNGNGRSIRYCGLRADYITREMVAGRFYEGRMLRWIHEHLPENMVFVDAGAHIGVHSLYFAIMCKAVRVYAFEPHPLTFQFLRANIAINGARSVVARQLALGSTLGRAHIVPCLSNDLGGSHIRSGKNGSVRVAPLDCLLPEMIDVLKIDVEGNSLAVLGGARGTLVRSKPDLFVECGEQDDHAAIGDLLASFGYVQVHCFNATPTYLYVYPGASRVNSK